MNFKVVPSLGITNDSGLVGYWTMNDGSLGVGYDSNVNGYNGTVHGAVWVDGRFGKALSFDGVDDYAQIPGLSTPQSFTISFWANIRELNRIQYLTEKEVGLPNRFEGTVWIGADNKIQFYIHDGTFNPTITSTATCGLGWVHIVAVRDTLTDSLYLYVNGTSAAAPVTDTTTGIITNTASRTFGAGNRNPAGRYFNGLMDEIRIYDRALSAAEVAALYSQPDPNSLANYYNFIDAVTNNTLMIDANNPNGNNTNVTLITCTNFFENNKLVLENNNSATVNLWTNLGQPVFIINGFWNRDNYTVTLTLDASSIGVVDWNRCPPSALNLALSSTIVSKIATFSSLWNDSYSLSGGGYFFSTNNTGQWVNASWVAFSSIPYWGNATLTLNNNVGVVVGFREYANNSLNVWADSGLYTVTTTNESSAPSPTPTSSSTPNTSPTPTTTPTPTATSQSSQTPIPTPTSTQDTLFSTQTIVIAALVVALLVVLSTVSFKRGYISVELVEETVEGDVDGNGAERQNESEDYMI